LIRVIRGLILDSSSATLLSGFFKTDPCHPCHPWPYFGFIFGFAALWIFLNWSVLIRVIRGLILDSSSALLLSGLFQP